jgi:hypothetical protein
LSIAATARRRSWLLPAGIALALMVAAAPAAYVLWQESRTTTPAPPFSAVPEAQQAPWKIETFPAGAIARIGKADRALAENRAAAVEGIVKDVYDTELMDPAKLPKVLDRAFTARAAESFAKAGLGVPKGATDVRSTSRRARIGVDIGGGRAAAADVKISLVGDLKGEKLEITQRATLWMQRDQRHWRVVGYDVKQGPTPAHRSNAGKSQKGRSGRGDR